MTNEPFTATINGKETPIYQNPNTGLFHAILPNGRHAPVDYPPIKTQTTSRQQLKYWRNRYGYTQADLAKLLNVSSPTIIMMWETGLRHPNRKSRKLLNTELGHDIFPD